MTGIINDSKADSTKKISRIIELEHRIERRSNDCINTQSQGSKVKSISRPIMRHAVSLKT